MNDRAQRGKANQYATVPRKQNEQRTGRKYGSTKFKWCECPNCGDSAQRWTKHQPIPGGSGGDKASKADTRGLTAEVRGPNQVLDGMCPGTNSAFVAPLCGKTHCAVMGVTGGSTLIPEG